METKKNNPEVIELVAPQDPAVFEELFNSWKNDPRHILAVPAEVMPIVDGAYVLTDVQSLGKVAPILKKHLEEDGLVIAGNLADSGFFGPLSDETLAYVADGADVLIRLLPEA